MKTYSFESIDATRRAKKIFIFPYYEAQIKSRDFSSKKQNEGNLKITKFPPFLESNPTEHQTIFNC